MDLENKVLLIQMRIKKFRNKFKKELEQKTEKEKAIFVFNENGSYLLKRSENV